MKKIVDNIEIDLTSEEIAEYNQKNTDWENNAFNIAIEELRNQRNQLLAETDYLALSDQTLTDKMKKYRQDLRDLTEGLTTKDEVDAVTFPTKP